ncbi:MAG: GNAT family N-acetyltransferase [bacterium]
MLDCLLDAARARGDRAVWLHAQLGAQSFYAARGFAPRGARFEEAGIEHIAMTRTLA